jgi:uncharacterized protein
MGMRITAVTLGVADLERAKRFYESLGGAVAKELPGFVSITLGEGSPDLALYPREGLAAMVGVSPDGAGFSGVVLDYNPPGKGKERVDDVLSQAARGGGTIVSAAHETEWGGRIGHFSDPDGNLWQVGSY